MAFTHDLPGAARRNLDAADRLYEPDKGLPRKDVAGYLYGIAADCVKGRNSQPLMRFIKDDAFMNNWHISMRYAAARQIRKEWVQAWQKQARDIVNAMDTGQ